MIVAFEFGFWFLCYLDSYYVGTWQTICIFWVERMLAISILG